MFAFLQGRGFLGTRGSVGSDVSLIIMLLAAVLLTVGWRLAVGKKLEAHHWVQTAAVCLNTIPVAVWMIRFFVLYVVPVLPADLNQGKYVLITVHAIVGAIGLLLGVAVVLRGNELLPKALRFGKFTLFMRLSYGLYMLGTILGLALYFVVYG